MLIHEMASDSVSRHYVGPRQLPDLIIILDEFGQVSKVRINVEKAIGIPLEPRAEADARELLADWAPCPGA